MLQVKLAVFPEPDPGYRTQEELVLVSSDALEKLTTALEAFKLE
jgi:hypothetical protein